MTTLRMEDLIEEFSQIEMAKESDNQRILDFYNQVTMQNGQEDISFDRGENFFDFYKVNSQKYWCFLFINKDGSIGGIGTILRQFRNIEGVYHPVAYFCDLRMSPKASRLTFVQWRKFFDKVINNMSNLCSDDYCMSAYTAILSDNKKAIDSLTRSGRGITYKKLGNYHVNSFITTGYFRSKKYSVKEISKSAYSEFYNKHSVEILLTEDPMIIANNLSKKCEQLFFLGVYEKGELVSVAMATHINHTRKLKVKNMSKSKLMATKILKLTNRPAADESGILKVLDISHFIHHAHYDQGITEEHIQAIQSWISKENLLKDIHIFSIISDKQREELSLLKSGISFDTCGTLFEIHPETTQGLIPPKKFQFEGAFL